MRVDFYGLALEAPKVTCYLYSPWRASALEHRLFDAVRNLPTVTPEQDFDELRTVISDNKTWKTALNAMVRVLKGWQEESDQREKRAWRWLLEGDTDDHGFDHAGEPACLWAFLRLAVDRGSFDDHEKTEEIDLNGFGLKIHPQAG